MKSAQSLKHIGCLEKENTDLRRTRMKLLRIALKLLKQIDRGGIEDLRSVIAEIMDEYNAK